MSTSYPDRFRALLPELVRFATVGGLGYAVDVIVFNALRIGEVCGPLGAKTVSLGLATTVAFFGNRYWTYRDRLVPRTDLRRQYVVFFVLSLAGMAIQTACLAVSHYGFGLTSLLADNIAGSVVGMALATAFRFWGYRTLVFRAPAAPEPLPANVQDRELSGSTR